MTRTSWLYPPSTGHQRPAERKFYIWQDQSISYAGTSRHAEGKRERHPWRWLCTHCEPPATGFRPKRGAYQAIITGSMPRHFQHRRQHHEWAARKPPGNST